jgi:hypothetical protein
MTAATGHPELTGRPIYLDYNATTPVDPRVVDAALPYLTTHFGNPSSAQAIVCEAEIQKGRAYGSPARSKDTTHSGASSPVHDPFHHTLPDGQSGDAVP